MMKPWSNDKTVEINRLESGNYEVKRDNKVIATEVGIKEAGASIKKAERKDRHRAELELFKMMKNKLKLIAVLISLAVVLLANNEAVTYIVLSLWVIPTVIHIAVKAISIDHDSSWLE